MVSAPRAVSESAAETASALAPGVGSGGNPNACMRSDEAKLHMKLLQDITSMIAANRVSGRQAVLSSSEFDA